MTMRLKADGTTGRVAIYDTSAGDAPFSSPLGNVSRLRFHSDLWSPAITVASPVSVAFPDRRPAAGYRSQGNVQHVLFAHGLAGTPMIKGYVTIGGVRVPLTGTIPLQIDDHGLGRFLSVGADATNVFVLEKWVFNTGTANPITLTFQIYVTDVILDGSGQQTQPNDPVTLSWTPTLFTAGRGRIRSDKRYFRANAPGPDFVFPTGETISLVKRTTNKTVSPFWRYAVNGYVQEQTVGDDNTAAAAQTFAATTQGVSL